MNRPLALVPELRVGSLDDHATALTEFRSLEVGTDGRIYTLHPQEDHIRIYDVNGQHLATVGGSGEGPGEFRSAWTMGWRADSLWVLDHGTNRFSYFDADGRFLASRNIPIDLGERDKVPPPRPEGLLADGAIFGASPPFSRLLASDRLRENVVLRLDPLSQPLDTIYRASLENIIWAIGDLDGPASMPTFPKPLILL